MTVTLDKIIPVKQYNKITKYKESEMDNCGS